MLFNSNLFLQFFAAFLLLYFLVRHSLPARNVLIVIASFVFYGAWDYRFLGLLLLTSLIDYAVGLGLEHSKFGNHRKALLAVSIVVNLVILGFFKYYDFFVHSFVALFARFDVTLHARTLGIILPVGISFYTFQSMSYAIDVYRRHIPATRNLVNFLAFVSFFPQLVAGPIERAAHLLPQFEKTLNITRDMLAEGIWLILWGMFKKVALADNLAPLADLVYQNNLASGPLVVLGTLAFAFQIYCDFSGYSDIARGTARILGFDIMVNFNLPYAALSPRDFWRRWHISLSTWLRDYLYISLGGNRRGKWQTYANLFLTMLLGGLWHGAAWNFVLWGLWHGGGLVLHRLWEEKANRHMPRLLAWSFTMLFVLYGWLLFRATSLEQIVSMTKALPDFSLPIWAQSYCINLAVFTLPLVIMEVWQKKSGSLLAPLSLPRWVQSSLQSALLIAVFLFWEQAATPFIYFQF